MSKNWILKSAIALALTIAMLIPSFSFVAISADLNTPLSASEATEEASVFDKILSLVSEKGSDIVKSALPTVGDFLCAKVFDCLGIDYGDSYTKEARKINEKLSLIQEDLQELLKNQNKQISQNTMLSFYNNVDVLADRIYPIYTGYCALTDKENSGEYTAEEAVIKEREFYEANLEKLIFGSSVSTGDLYLQLKNYADTICLPNATVQHISLMEHYSISYEHRWAFESQSFKPKKEFIAYASATLIEGLALYAFENTYKKAHANDTQTVVLETEWARLQASASKALDYLKKELQAIEKREKEVNDAGTIYHYASGLTLSKEMYVSKVHPVEKGKHLTYAVCRAKRGSACEPIVYALNQRSLMNQIQNDFQNYKKYYNKGSDCKISDFLKEAGFVSDNWDAYLYRGQSFKGENNFVGDDHYRFYLEYADYTGSSKSSEWACITGYSTFKFKKATFDKKDSAGWSLMAFVKSDGYLAGDYEATYSYLNGKTGRGTEVPNMIHSNIGLYNPTGDERGKVK